MLKTNFTNPLLAWFDKEGRKDLPWQHPRSPYRVWISEIMLQQTQVKTVIPYFNKFMESFPTLSSLAQACDDAVLSNWSGLGYYSRARNLLKTAQIIESNYQGIFPSDLEQLIALPGIGPSTAAAIASQAYNRPTAIMDGNVKRVLCRYFLIEGWTEKAQIKNQLWELAQSCMQTDRCADYTQAIMDLGATCCTQKNPDCEHCPLQNTCRAWAENRAAELPHKKPKKAIPVKKQRFILLHADQKIYLEKRPPTGIWGGLWCLPATDENIVIDEFVQSRYALRCLDIKPLIQIKHSFSHFHLEIDAVAVETSNQGVCVAESSGLWFGLEDLSNLGLAKPVSDIIRVFYQ